MILVSACLAGCPCRYDGGTNLVPELQKLAEDGEAVLACPEELGGLPTPRDPSECLKDKVITNKGKDVTAEFLAGAERTLRIAQENGCKKAILKARSPSCGKGFRYNGFFNKTLVAGNGVTAQLLLDHGIEVFTEEELSTALCNASERSANSSG
ncbi:MAG: DUF523 domain-containing protein [Oscillospiraceae bacterium]|nr:DUF523 domain-containing protein [Oscillospiraceae bacterium]